jgi:DNA polymerase-3 subunit alpha
VIEGNGYLKELVETAAKLEGVARNAGTHAAGVIISDKPITDYIPLHRPTKGSPEDSPVRAVTQFGMGVLESLGLLKIDYLGLSTLTVMARACDLILRRHAVELDIDSIPLDDPKTFELLGSGNVLGVFQVEGAGMRRHLVDMKPSKLAQVTAMVALYRPGPMEFIPAYIRRMHGAEAVTYRHPALKPILEETYGITVYQEQIMYTAMQLAGYSAAEADNLRQAVAKKKAGALRQQRHKFVQGAVTNRIPEDTANTIFDDWEAFARYGFPKGHAADYAVICVQTAYLKANYPIEYMTALLSVFKSVTDRVALYSAECRRMGMEVLPPEVGASGLDFEIEDRLPAAPAVRFGLGAIKNVGQGAVETILAARAAGPFADLEDFARRVDLRQVGRRALESLIRVGAADRLGSRLDLLESLERIISFSAAQFRAAEIGQLSLFGGATGVAERLELQPATVEISSRKQLSWERELLGSYVSDHPLAAYMDSLAKVVTHYSGEINESTDGQSVCVAGEISALRPYLTRKGNEMAFLSLEDVQGTIEVVIFQRLWESLASQLNLNEIVLVKGRVDAARGEAKLLADEIIIDLSQAQAAPSAPERALVHQPSIAEDLMPPLPSALPAQPLAVLESWDESHTHEVLAHDPGAQGPLAQELLPSWWEGPEPCLVTILLRSSGDRLRDARRMRQIHGLLASFPGSDRFAFKVYEASRRYNLEFPSYTTRYSPELHRSLLRIVGDQSVEVSPLRLH